MIIDIKIARRLAKLHNERDKLLSVARDIQRCGIRAEFYIAASRSIGDEITNIERGYIGAAAL